MECNAFVRHSAFTCMRETQGNAGHSFACVQHRAMQGAHSHACNKTHSLACVLKVVNGSGKPPPSVCPETLCVCVCVCVCACVLRASF